MLKTIMMFLILIFSSTLSFSQDNEINYRQKVDEIISKQVLPSESELNELYYLPYASAKGALEAYDQMPKPTYILKKDKPFRVTKDGPERLVTMYYVYFTPKTTNEKTDS